LYEFYVISVDAQCITTVIMKVIARGAVHWRQKKCGAITFSKFELAGKWNQRLVLERWAETRWFPAQLLVPRYPNRL
jgi:hypothetical protein